MADWVDTATVLLAFDEVVKGPFRRIREALPGAINPEGPTLNAFAGFPGTGGAGLDICLLARREDGRALRWMVELWIDQRQGRWYATAKGEIDLDDDEGHDRCVLNEQRPVTSGADAAVAIRELGEMVSKYPIHELLSKQ